ncbi:hypothetical protein [Hydrogenophaga sp.]|uniref:hypothetical protein n=1 Tax=Hydrogenophaga sp. TaxID=1904254 RepID=UPI003F6F9E88
MQVHATGDFQGAIVIESDSMSRLWRCVEEFASNATATVSCSDGIERKFERLEDLLAYDNPIRAAIRTIELYGVVAGEDKSISVTLGGFYGARAKLSIRGDEHEATVARTRILDSFAGMKSWYSPFAKVDLWFFLILAFIVGMLLLYFMTPSEPPSRPARSFLEAIRVMGNAVMFLAPVIGFGYLILRLKSRFFPMVCFAIGQGIRRHRTDEQVRWVVIVGVLVSLVASAVYSQIGGS